MQASVSGQLWMEGHRQDIVLPHGDRVPVDFGEHLHSLSDVIYPRRTYENSAHRAGALHRDVGFEALDLTAERVAAGADIKHTEVFAVEHNHPCAGSEHRCTGSNQPL